MHVTGKILVFFVLAAAVGALVLSARLVDARGQWMKQLQEIKTQTETSAEQLTTARLERDQAREALEREMLRWNRVWSDVRAGLGPNGELIADLGSAAGLENNGTVYAFLLGPKGESSYVGGFSVVQLQPNQAALKAAFRIRPEDVPNWSGQQWRFRSTIPSAFASRVAGLETELVAADELLAKQEANLAAEINQVAAATKQRDERIEELMGQGKQPGSGLLAQIVQAEDQRSHSLGEVDRLRREVSAAVSRSQELIKQNRQLSDGLRRPSPDTALVLPR